MLQSEFKNMEYHFVLRHILGETLISSGFGLLKEAVIKKILNSVRMKLNVSSKLLFMLNMNESKCPADYVDCKKHWENRRYPIRTNDLQCL